MNVIVLILLTFIFSSFGFGQKVKPQPAAKPTPKISPTLDATPIPVTTLSPTPESSKCDLTLKDAPVLRELKLGTTEDEMVNLFSMKKDYVLKDTNTEGVQEANVFINLPSPLYRPPSFLRGVFMLTFKTYLSSVFELQLRYEPTEIKFDDDRQFAKNISDSFNLPADAWSYKGFGAVISCKEFKVAVISSLNQITLTDLTTEQKIKEREEQKRKTFKP